jgi:hypothetical protein
LKPRITFDVKVDFFNQFTAPNTDNVSST